eukprot:2316437-Lingulodinium_polyedra.AAC.1
MLLMFGTCKSGPFDCRRPANERGYSSSSADAMAVQARNFESGSKLRFVRILTLLGCLFGCARNW